MNLCRLVTTADDVGLHPALTDGALRAHDDGIVTAVAVAANGSALDAAIPALLARPELDVGAHLVLVGERPLSPPSEIPSLVGRDGLLLPGFVAFALRALAGGIDPADLRRELGRQVERLLERGLTLRHLNSHQHLHALPIVAGVVIELALRHGISWIRVPSERHPGGLSLRALEMRVLERLSRRFRRQVSGTRLRATARTIGIASAGRFAPTVVDPAADSAVDSAVESVELVVHPGTDDAALARHYGWGYTWESELAHLRSSALRERLSQLRIEPARFRDL